MKKVFLFLVVFAFLANTVRSQVTIGKAEEPEKGVFLDLNPKNVTRGGLLLPNVPITNYDSIPVNLIGTFTPAERDYYPNLSGLVVYNTNENMVGGNGIGVYYWDGGKWNSGSGGNGGFISTCAASSVGAAGGSISCSATDPSCTTGGVYTFNFISGSEYAQLDVTDAGNGAYTLTLDANNRAVSRTVILMITSPCGKSQTFFYTQDGDNTGCNASAADPKIVAENSLTSLCSGGAVYLYLNGTPAGTYIWTLNGAEVGTGVRLVATHPGKYIVYANKIGCTTNKPDTMTVTAGSTGAPSRVSIIVGQNNGLVCSESDKVKLFATDAGNGTIHWYLDGSRTALTGASIDAEIGTWFAVVEDGSCQSKPSDPVEVKLDPNAGNSTINDFTFTVNGVTLSTTMNLCAGGTLNLEVISPQTGVDYTWYNNNTVIGQGASITYSMAGMTSSFILRCRATGQGGCSKEKLTEATIDVGQAPGRPWITVSNPGDALCGGSAVLTANVSETVSSYIWYYSANNSSYSPLSATTQTLPINQTGYYKVAAVSGNCVSKQSGEKNIALSSALTGVSIVLSGSATINQGDTRTYIAQMDNPQGAQYAWSITGPNTAGAAIQGPANGSSVTVNYAAAGDATLSLNASNACGDATPRPAILGVTVLQNCTPASISPAIAAGDQPVNVLTGKTLSLSVTGGGSPTLSYQWYKNGSPIGSPSPIGNYTKDNVTSADADTYYCIVTSSCGTTSSATSANFVVTVQKDPKDLPLGAGSLSGRTCFDIAENANGTGCGDLAARASNKANFASLTNADKTYTFTAKSANVNNVRFVVVDNEGCVESTSTLTPNGTGTLANGSSVFLTVNYETTLNDANSSPLIQNRSRSQAAEVLIYVVYNNGSADVQVPLRVTIQDCMCCGALVAANTWKVFMCHNLGADQSVNPFTPTYATNGAYYQFGRKEPAKSAPTSSGADATNITWNSSTPSGTFGDGSTGADVKVKSATDPCPSGYRVPSYNELDYMRQNNTRTNVGSWTNGTNSWVGAKFGSGLMLPAAGGRNGSDGVLNNRGSHGLYWSTRANSATYAYRQTMTNTTHTMGNSSRADGLSVRCIAE